MMESNILQIHYKYNDKGELPEIRYMKNTVLAEKRVFSKNGAATNVSIL